MYMHASSRVYPKGHHDNGIITKVPIKNAVKDRFEFSDSHAALETKQEENNPAKAHERYVERQYEAAFNSKNERHPDKVLRNYYERSSQRSQSPEAGTRSNVKSNGWSRFFAERPGDFGAKNHGGCSRFFAERSTDFTLNPNSMSEILNGKAIPTDLHRLVKKNDHNLDRSRVQLNKKNHNLDGMPHSIYDIGSASIHRDYRDNHPHTHQGGNAPQNMSRRERSAEILGRHLPGASHQVKYSGNGRKDSHFFAKTNMENDFSKPATIAFHSHLNGVPSFTTIGIGSATAAFDRKIAEQKRIQEGGGKTDNHSRSFEIFGDVNTSAKRSASGVRYDKQQPQSSIKRDANLKIPKEHQGHHHITHTTSSKNSSVQPFRVDDNEHNRSIERARLEEEDKKSRVPKSYAELVAEQSNLFKHEGTDPRATDGSSCRLYSPLGKGITTLKHSFEHHEDPRLEKEYRYNHVHVGNNYGSKITSMGSSRTPSPPPAPPIDFNGYHAIVYGQQGGTGYNDRQVDRRIWDTADRRGTERTTMSTNSTAERTMSLNTPAQMRGMTMAPQIDQAYSLVATTSASTDIKSSPTATQHKATMQSKKNGKNGKKIKKIKAPRGETARSNALQELQESLSGSSVQQLDGSVQHGTTNVEHQLEHCTNVDQDLSIGVTPAFNGPLILSERLEKAIGEVVPSEGKQFRNNLQILDETLLEPINLDSERSTPDEFSLRKAGDKLGTLFECKNLACGVFLPPEKLLEYKTAITNVVDSTIERTLKIENNYSEQYKQLKKYCVKLENKLEKTIRREKNDELDIGNVGNVTTDTMDVVGNNISRSIMEDRSENTSTNLSSGNTNRGIFVDAQQSNQQGTPSTTSQPSQHQHPPMHGTPPMPGTTSELLNQSLMDTLDKQPITPKTTIRMMTPPSPRTGYTGGQDLLFSSPGNSTKTTLPPKPHQNHDTIISKYQLSVSPLRTMNQNLILQAVSPKPSSARNILSSDFRGHSPNSPVSIVGSIVNLQSPDVKRSPRVLSPSGRSNASLQSGRSNTSIQRLDSLPASPRDPNNVMNTRTGGMMSASSASHASNLTLLSAPMHPTIQRELYETGHSSPSGHHSQSADSGLSNMNPRQDFGALQSNIKSAESHLDTLTLEALNQRIRETEQQILKEHAAFREQAAAEQVAMLQRAVADQQKVLESVLSPSSAAGRSLLTGSFISPSPDDNMSSLAHSIAAHSRAAAAERGMSPGGMSSLLSGSFLSPSSTVGMSPGDCSPGRGIMSPGNDYSPRGMSPGGHSAYYASTVPIGEWSPGGMSPTSAVPPASARIAAMSGVELQSKSSARSVSLLSPVSPTNLGNISISNNMTPANSPMSVANVNGSPIHRVPGSPMSQSSQGYHSATGASAGFHSVIMGGSQGAMTGSQGYVSAGSQTPGLVIGTSMFGPPRPWSLETSIFGYGTNAGQQLNLLPSSYYKKKDTLKAELKQVRKVQKDHRHTHLNQLYRGNGGNGMNKLTRESSSCSSSAGNRNGNRPQLKKNNLKSKLTVKGVKGFKGMKISLKTTPKMKPVSIARSGMQMQIGGALNLSNLSIFGGQTQSSFQTSTPSLFGGKTQFGVPPHSPVSPTTASFLAATSSPTFATTSSPTFATTSSPTTTGNGGGQSVISAMREQQTKERPFFSMSPTNAPVQTPYFGAAEKTPAFISSKAQQLPSLEIEQEASSVQSSSIGKKECVREFKPVIESLGRDFKSVREVDSKGFASILEDVTDLETNANMNVITENNPNNLLGIGPDENDDSSTIPPVSPQGGSLLGKTVSERVRNSVQNAIFDEVSSEISNEVSNHSRENSTAAGDRSKDGVKKKSSKDGGRKENSKDSKERSKSSIEATSRRLSVIDRVHSISAVDMLKSMDAESGMKRRSSLKYNGANDGASMSLGRASMSLRRASLSLGEAKSGLNPTPSVPSHAKGQALVDLGAEDEKDEKKLIYDSHGRKVVNNQKKNESPKKGEKRLKGYVELTAPNGKIYRKMIDRVASPSRCVARESSVDNLLDSKKSARAKFQKGLSGGRNFLARQSICLSPIVGGQRGPSSPESRDESSTGRAESRGGTRRKGREIKSRKDKADDSSSGLSASDSDMEEQEDSEDLSVDTVDNRSNRVRRGSKTRTFNETIAATLNSDREYVDLMRQKAYDSNCLLIQNPLKKSSSDFRNQHLSAGQGAMNRFSTIYCAEIGASPESGGPDGSSSGRKKEKPGSSPGFSSLRNKAMNIKQYRMEGAGQDRQLKLSPGQGHFKENAHGQGRNLSDKTRSTSAAGRRTTGYANNPSDLLDMSKNISKQRLEDKILAGKMINQTLGGKMSSVNARPVSLFEQRQGCQQLVTYGSQQGPTITTWNQLMAQTRPALAVRPIKKKFTTLEDLRAGEYPCNMLMDLKKGT